MKDQETDRKILKWLLVKEVMRFGKVMWILTRLNQLRTMSDGKYV
jgi:hypothetical protein